MTMCHDKGEEYFKYADSVREQLHSMYKVMVDKISENYFQDVHDLIENQTRKRLPMSESIEKLKKSLAEHLENRLTLSWNHYEVNTSLSSLKYAKDFTKDDRKKFRPTGDNIKEQVRPIAIRKLDAKKKFLQRNIQFQDQTIEGLVFDVEESRNMFQQQKLERKQTKEQMHNMIEQIHEVSKHVDEIYDDLE